MSLGRLHTGQTQLCWRSLGQGYLNWTLCKVRIVWTLLMMYLCVLQGGPWRRGWFGQPLHVPVKTRIWKALPSAGHVLQVDTQTAAPDPLHASAHTNTGSEKPPNCGKKLMLNTAGIVSGVGC